MASDILRLNWAVRFVHLPELSTGQAGKPYVREQALGGSDEGLSPLDIASAVATGCPLGVGCIWCGWNVRNPELA